MLRANSTDIVDMYKWNPLETAANCGKNTSTYNKVGVYILQNNTYTLFDDNEDLFQIQSKDRGINCSLKASRYNELLNILSFAFST